MTPLEKLTATLTAASNDAFNKLRDARERVAGTEVDGLRAEFLRTTKEVFDCSAMIEEVEGLQKFARAMAGLEGRALRAAVQEQLNKSAAQLRGTCRDAVAEEEECVPRGAAISRYEAKEFAVRLLEQLARAL